MQSSSKNLYTIKTSITSPLPLYVNSIKGHLCTVSGHQPL